jgi:hypothetical protein
MPAKETPNYNMHQQQTQQGRLSHHPLGKEVRQSRRRGRNTTVRATQLQSSISQLCNKPETIPATSLFFSFFFESY